MKIAFHTLDIASLNDRVTMANFIADISDHYGFSSYTRASDPMSDGSSLSVNASGYNTKFATKLTPDTYLYIGSWEAERPYAFRWMPGSIVQKAPQRLVNTISTDFGTFAVLLDGAFAAISRRENRFMGQPPILCDLLSGAA